MDASASKKRILILGGGFGGVATARHLEGLCRRRPDVEIVLVSRDNLGAGTSRSSRPCAAEAISRCGLGDCASIPGPDGKPYPNLAQHALRQARVLAGNIVRGGYRPGSC